MIHVDGGSLLQLIRKPDRDWNTVNVSATLTVDTALQLIRKPDRDWNMLVLPNWEQSAGLQLIRKPDRDWNKIKGSQTEVRRKLQLIRKPDRDWNNYDNRRRAGGNHPRYNSLENPIGIETLVIDGSESPGHTGVTTH